MFSLGIKASNCLLVAGSSAFLAFGLYNVHSLSGVTEGGVLGMTLLLEHLFSVSPSVSGFVMNALALFREAHSPKQHRDAPQGLIE